ncbi:EF-Hand 1 [Vigna unguiculata]|uniref:EF-Hand 1 n=1 Tax=Vigna unguiculata TaxID=3917 RepID=A0A4D6MF71_VIGUN|nr:EF-Hand 1 [Vigna unguiculata]
MPVFIPTTDPYKVLPPKIIMAENQIREILRRADRNGDGYLSKDELKKAFKEFGSKLPGWRAGRFLKKVDNGGQLNMEELDIVVDYALSRYNFTK